MTHFTHVSDEYGVIVTETNLGEKETHDFIELIRPQIEKQALVEMLYENTNPMFHYGLRWGRLIPQNKNIKPMDKKTIVNIHQYDDQIEYAYSNRDQHGRSLPPINHLDPIIKLIETSLRVDLSNYDVMIGNIYLDGLFIPPHKDTSESKQAQNYPIIVFTLGNDSALGIWDNRKGIKLKNKYDNFSARIPHPPPTNEILTKNGTIYTIGLHGAKRFELLHATPCTSSKPIAYPEIRLPNTLDLPPKLRDLTISHYTITLTFRRAQDPFSKLTKN